MIDEGGEDDEADDKKSSVTLEPYVLTDCVNKGKYSFIGLLPQESEKGFRGAQDIIS